MRAALGAFTVQELVDISRRAAESFVKDTLPVGDDAQTPDDYVRQLSATTGMPHVLVRRNMEKIRSVLADLGTVIAGLTRGLDLTVLDTGVGDTGGHALSFIQRTPTLGVVLPSNSPGVHSLWVPAIALKTALVLKPGSAEPWTPYRLIQAFLKAGAPPEAFGFYPTDHAGAGEILRRTGRGIVFGDVASTRPWQRDPRVEVHGPGYSKVVLGPDASGRLAPVPRGDRLVGGGERRPLLRQRLRSVGDRARARDRRGPGREARADPPPRRGRSRGAARTLRQPRRGPAHLGHDRPRSRRAGCRGRDGPASRGRARRRVGGRHLPAAHGGSLRLRRPSPGQSRVPVSVRRGGAGEGRGDAPGLRVPPWPSPPSRTTSRCSRACSPRPSSIG